MSKDMGEQINKVMNWRQFITEKRMMNFDDWKIQEEWFRTHKQKHYEIIIPPYNLSELKTMINQQKQSSGKGSEEGMENKWINDAISGKDYGTLGHEIIHFLQGRDTDMFNKLPPLDYLGNPEVKWESWNQDIERKKYYYSRPPEIMAFAWTYFINKDKDGRNVKAEYERIGVEVYELFLRYVKEYSSDDKSKNWVENFKKFSSEKS